MLHNRYLLHIADALQSGVIQNESQGIAGAMEFDFYIPGLGNPPITCWSADALKRLSKQDLDNLKLAIDVFGKRSAVAQGLSGPITDIYKLRSTDQRLYLYATNSRQGVILLGGIKVGTKKLFLRTETGALLEMEPTCVLDFYVHESCQRQGTGKMLFEHFLAQEQQHPALLAYDRPSSKLLAFLKKHCGLSEYVPQSNNFVVFSDHFKLRPPQQAPGSSRSTWASITARPLTSSRNRGSSLQPHTCMTWPSPGAHPMQLAHPPYGTNIAAPSPGMPQAQALQYGSTPAPQQYTQQAVAVAEPGRHVAVPYSSTAPLQSALPVHPHSKYDGGSGDDGGAIAQSAGPQHYNMYSGCKTNFSLAMSPGPSPAPGPPTTSSSYSYSPTLGSPHTNSNLGELCSSGLGARWSHSNQLQPGYTHHQPQTAHQPFQAVASTNPLAFHGPGGQSASNRASLSPHMLPAAPALHDTSGRAHTTPSLATGTTTSQTYQQLDALDSFCSDPAAVPQAAPVQAHSTGCPVQSTDQSTHHSQGTHGQQHALSAHQPPTNHSNLMGTATAPQLAHNRPAISSGELPRGPRYVVQPPWGVAADSDWSAGGDRKAVHTRKTGFSGGAAAAAAAGNLGRPWPDARAAGAAQRSGAGAADCLVW